MKCRSPRTICCCRRRRHTQAARARLATLTTPTCGADDCASAFGTLARSRRQCRLQQRHALKQVYSFSLAAALARVRPHTAPRRQTAQCVLHRSKTCARGTAQHRVHCSAGCRFPLTSARTFKSWWRVPCGTPPSALRTTRKGGAPEATPVLCSGLPQSHAKTQLCRARKSTESSCL